MWSRSLFLVSLLLLPALAFAQPAPFTWSMMASACLPDESASGLRATSDQGLSFRPGAVSPVADLFALTVRCPVTGTGQGVITALALTATDPDSGANAAWVRVRLFRDGQVLRRWDSRDVWVDPGVRQIYVRAFPPTVLDFAQHTYWVELALVRQSRLTVAPRIHSVRLVAPARPAP
jgi:hypothetical protein